MALPSGKPQDPPTGILKNIYLWIGFSLLLVRFFSAALTGRFRQRWNGTA
jgi:hypothetical protein